MNAVPGHPHTGLDSSAAVGDPLVICDANKEAEADSDRGVQGTSQSGPPRSTVNALRLSPVGSGPLSEVCRYLGTYLCIFPSQSASTGNPDSCSMT